MTRQPPPLALEFEDEFVAGLRAIFEEKIVFNRVLGLQVVSWGPMADDWREQTPDHAAARATEKMAGGDILLLHDAVEPHPGEAPPTFDRVRMVELVLDRMGERGLTPATVGRLVAEARPHLSPWFEG